MNLESLGVTPEQHQHIMTLFAKHGGWFSRELFVQAAEPENSPIHDLLTWNNRHAAHQYRLRQAARILRAYIPWYGNRKNKKGAALKFDSSKIPLAVKVRRHPEDKEKVLVLTANALESKYMRGQVILDRVGRVKSSLNQLLLLPELVDLHEQVNMLIDTYVKTVLRKMDHVRT